VTAVNATDRPTTVDLGAVAPDGWTVDVRDGKAAGLAPGEGASFALDVTPAETPWRPFSSRLDLLASVDGRVLTFTTGLLRTIPVLHWPLGDLPEDCPAPSDAQLLEASSHFIELSQVTAAQACHAFCVEFKMPFAARVRFVTQAPRPLRVWLNAERINDLPGGFEVPAIHRAGATGADRQVRRGVYRLTIAAGRTGGPPGRLFFGMGDPGRWSWISALEFRPPSG
jgi:hypothetical protein